MREICLPPAPSDAAELDEPSLQRLRELDPDGSKQVVSRVLRAFEASLQRLLPQAAQALEQRDAHALRHVVHTLKSSSASVGALELSRRCGEIENRLRTDPGDDLAPALTGLQREGDRVLVAVQAMLAA
jgi:HPt (histidine-containing phosphotransfer) domain-containing protein